MPRRKLFFLCALTALVLAGGITALVTAAKHEPNFYRQAQLPESPGRTQLALECLSKFTQMDNNRKAKTPEWGCDLSEAHINSFFAEILMKEGDAEKLRKLGISSPSVILEDDHLRLAFNYDTGWFTSVISYNLKIWLVPKEPNTIAIEFLSARAGALPISSQAILQQLCDVARKQDTKVSLYRHEGNSVAVIHLQPNENHPWWMVTALQVKAGEFKIRGKTYDHALPAPIITPVAAPK